LAALIPAIGTTGLAHRDHVCTVHQWCRARFVADNAGLPENSKNSEACAGELVGRIIPRQRGQSELDFQFTLTSLSLVCSDDSGDDGIGSG